MGSTDQRALFIFPEPEPTTLGDIRFLTEYHPLRNGKNPDFDHESGRLLRLKAGGYGSGGQPVIDW